MRRRPGNDASPGRPIWAYLVALTLLPVLALPVLGGLLTATKVSSARTAGRVENAMVVIQRLDELGATVIAEATAVGVTGAVAGYHVSSSSLSGLAGLRLAADLPTSRATTDRAMQALVAADEGSTVRGLERELTAARGLTTPPPATGTMSQATVWPAIRAYGKVSEEIAQQERATATAIVAGRFGAATGDVLYAASQLEQVTAAVAAEGDQILSTVLLILAPVSDQPEIAHRLRSDTVDYQERQSQLSDDLSGSLGASWARLIRQPEVVMSESFAAAFASSPPSSGELSLASLGAVSAASLSLKAFGAFLHEAVLSGTGTAIAAAHRANDEALLTLVATAGIFSLTIIALFTVGGLIRRRLRALSKAAAAFSGGSLNPVSLRGPREVAAAGAALNQAVTSLRQIQTQADVLARGDLDNAVLEKRVGGPLGEAIHASVERLVAVTRAQNDLRLELAYQAAHDPLTGLPNRAEATRILNKALVQLSTAENSLAVLFIDLDNFKECNDSLGHQAGDQTLCVVAARMASVVGERGRVCRLGGDEFLVILPNMSLSAACDLGDEIIGAVGYRIPYEDGGILIGASIGITIAEQGSDVSDLLREADIALYAAKRAGRGVARIYGPDAGHLAAI